MRTLEVAKRRPQGLDPRSFASVHQKYLDALRAAGYSASYVKHARLQLPRFFEHLRQRRIRDLRNVSEADVFDYARHLATAKRLKTGKPYSFSSQTTHLLHIKRLFRFLERIRMILRSPAEDLVYPTWEKLPRAVPTEAQAARLVSVASNTVLGKRDRAILELLYGSGVRIGACASLELRDLDLGKGTVFIRNAKGRKDRVVPIAGRAALAMEVYLKESRPKLLKDPREQSIFLNSRGGPMQRKTIQQMVRAQVRAAGLPTVLTAHSLRHGFATHLLQRGADIRHVQKLLGHSQIQTTALYTRVIPGDVGKMLDEKHPRRTYNRKKRRRSGRR